MTALLRSDVDSAIARLNEGDATWFGETEVVRQAGDFAVWNGTGWDEYGTADGAANAVMRLEGGKR